ncbi:hypothetical protein THIX_10184 [Thiomonas sp. X19]|nr:hypothetical protein THIX_10184 [Thiomonas sp. X19]
MPAPDAEVKRPGVLGGWLVEIKPPWLPDTVDVASQTQEMLSLAHILANERESLLPIFSTQEVWYVIVAELPPPLASGSVSSRSGLVH